MRTIFKKRLSQEGNALPPIEENAFVLLIDTEISNGDFTTTTEMAIPRYGTGYNFTIDWGDGTIENLTNADSQFINNEFDGFLHSYASHGIYRIQITGTFPRIKFLDHLGGDADKIREMFRWSKKVIELEQWGSIAWDNMEEAFQGCMNMRGTYTDNPNTTNVTSMERMFRVCKLFNSPLDIDGTNVTTTESMFSSCYLLNKSISISNTTNLTNTENMFVSCRSFNSSITLNTSNVTKMRGMFAGCHTYNQPVAFLSTANVTDFSSLFYNCRNFNQSVTSISTTSATNMHAMFYGCRDFNQSVSHFNLSSVTSIWGTARMFYNCVEFNQSVSSLSSSSIKNMEEMFSGCINFDGSGIESFDLSGLDNKQSLDFFAFDCEFSCAQYDIILIAWDDDKVTNSYRTDLRPHFGKSQYNTGTGNGEEARDNLITYGWTIIDEGTCGSSPSNPFDIEEDWTFQDEGFYLFTNNSNQDSAQHDLTQRDPYSDPSVGPDGKGSPWSFKSIDSDTILGLRLDFEDDNVCHPSAPDYEGDLMPTTGNYAPIRDHYGVFNDNTINDPDSNDFGPPQKAEAWIVIKSNANQTLKVLLNGIAERADPPNGTDWNTAGIYEEMRMYIEESSTTTFDTMGDEFSKGSSETWFAWARAPGGAQTTEHSATCDAGVGKIVTFLDFPDDHDDPGPETRINEFDLVSGDYYRIRIALSTNDAWYHVAAFYEFFIYFV